MTKIVLECNPDEVFLKCLGFFKKQIIHQPNKGQVINYLKKNPGSIGIVDEDPGVANPSYMNDFINTNQGNHNIEVLHHKKDNNTIFIIKPRLEEWVMGHAKTSKIDPATFYLPAVPKELHKRINYHIPKFEDFLMAISEANNPGFAFLKSTIQQYISK